MLISNKIKSRGDTLIEVLFAISVFSLVAVGGISIMNQGVNASQRALEITLVRNEIDAQAETLRFLNASYVSAYQSGAASYSDVAGKWKSMSTDAELMVGNISPFGSTCDAPSGSFILNTKTATFIKKSGNEGLFKPANTFAQVLYDGNNILAVYGMWVEAIKSGNDSSNSDYIDFHIRACWDAPGQSTHATLGTIVRLYEPTN